MTTRIALVTGAGGLLGYHHTKALLDIGYSVIASDLSVGNLARLEEDFYGTGRLILQNLDVCDEQAVKNVSEAYDISVLVNNAAINPSVKSDGLLDSNRLESFDFNILRSDWDVSILGALHCVKHIGFKMHQRSGGSIVNVASDLGVIAPDQRIYKQEGLSDIEQSVKPVSYSLIKHALVGLTKYVSTYWPNIKCNTLSPGGVYVDQPKAFVEKLEQRIPMGRMAKPGDYEGAIKFLCSGESDYMTGQNLIIDGGRSAW